MFKKTFWEQRRGEVVEITPGSGVGFVELEGDDSKRKEDAVFGLPIDPPVTVGTIVVCHCRPSTHGLIAKNLRPINGQLIRQPNRNGRRDGSHKQVPMRVALRHSRA